jgi:hypothetical protein
MTLKPQEKGIKSMKEIYVLKYGESVPAKIERIFQPHGFFHKLGED